jgi:hypothetical protein
MQVIRHVSDCLLELACPSAFDFHSNNLVVTLATPDFSMPYIVSALTGSVIAVFSGLYFTILTERRRILAIRTLDSPARKKRVIKLAVVALVFAVLVPVMDDDWRDWIVRSLRGLGVPQESLESIGLV